MPLQHPIYFFARAGHPLARSNEPVRAADVLAWAFASPSRIPPRLLEPLLAAHREGSSRSSTTRPFPAIECNGLATVKRIVASSDAVSASILPCIAEDLDSGRFVLLATTPWMILDYGVVSLRDRPWTQTAETLRDFVLEAESDAAELERKMQQDHAPEGRVSRQPKPGRRRRRSG
jgi:DNA-binding transcriptional LysR family regulator